MRLRGPFAAVGAAPVFTPMRLADALSGSPEDPNGIFNSVVEDAAGFAVEIQGAVVLGMAQCAWFRFAMPASWRGDGTQAIKYRFSEVSSGGSRWFAVGGVLDKSGLTLSSPVGLGVGFRVDAVGVGDRRVYSCNSTTAAANVVGTVVGVTGNGLIIPGGPDDTNGSAGMATALARSGEAQWESNSMAAAVVANTGTKVLTLGFGTNLDTSGGAVTGKAKFEFAVIELDAAGIFP